MLLHFVMYSSTFRLYVSIFLRVTELCFILVEYRCVRAVVRVYDEEDTISNVTLSYLCCRELPRPLACTVNCLCCMLILFEFQLTCPAEYVICVK